MISDRYFDWLVSLIAGDRLTPQYSFNKLFTQLHNTAFTYINRRDADRAYDGLDLRYRFTKLHGYYESDLDNMPPVASIFEVMVALSIRCESFMDDFTYGDRTGQWFWSMVASLGLNGQYDSKYDEQYVKEALDRFLYRDYNPDGSGGLFTVRHCELDMRDLEIWRQLLLYLDTLALCDDI